MLGPMKEDNTGLPDTQHTRLTMKHATTISRIIVAMDFPGFSEGLGAVWVQNTHFYTFYSTTSITLQMQYKIQYKIYKKVHYKI